MAARPSATTAKSVQVVEVVKGEHGSQFDLVISPDGTIEQFAKADGVAERAGVRPGSKITAVNGVPVVSRPDITAQLRRAPIGSTISLALLIEHVDGRGDANVLLPEGPPSRAVRATYNEAKEMNSCGRGVLVGLLLVAMSRLFKMEYLVLNPTASVAWALAWALWLFGYGFILIMLTFISVYATGMHEKYLVAAINSALYSTGENGSPTGILSSPVTTENLEIRLLKCRITVLNLTINAKMLDDAVFDPFLNWSPLRTRKMELGKFEIRWSLLRAPRLHVAVGGLHIATFGQWNDDACLIRSFRLARTGLWGWVDGVYNRDRDRVARKFDASKQHSAAGQAVLRSFCNKTGKLLILGAQGDDRWFHKRGTAYDVCGKVYDSFSAAEQRHYVEVMDAASLQSEAGSFAYRVVGGRQTHAEWAASQPQTAATAPSSGSWLMDSVASNLQVEMSDFRFSYTQMSVKDCPVGMYSEYIRTQERSSTNSSNTPECELHGFLIRIGKLGLGPNVRCSLKNEADEWERAWNQLAPRGERHFEPSPERLKFDDWELESFKVPHSDLDIDTMSRVGKQIGVLENFSFHLLGGAQPSDESHVPSQAGFSSHVERTTGPFYDDDTEDRNTRAPLVLLSSEFEFYRTGTGISPIGEIGRIDCPRSKLRIKLSTQDAAILVPIAARFGTYKSNADAGLSYGTTSLRPSLSGFACVKQRLTARERWKWSCLAIQQSRRGERSDLSWELLQQRCDIRKRFVAAWKRYIYQDLKVFYWNWDGDALGKAAAEQERTTLRDDAKVLENALEYDQCIMYRRIAWMHVMSEVECSLDPPCALAHGRNRMLQLIDNSNQWVWDFGYMCPQACHCANVDYELCIAEESVADTKRVEEFARALSTNDSQAIDFTDGTATSLLIRLQIVNEARLPEVRFSVSQGAVDLCHGEETHRLATFSTIRGEHAFAAGAWLIGSPLADSGDPISAVLRLSDVHMVHDPSLGDFLGRVGASFAPFGALSARLPPLAPDPPDMGALGILAAKVPSLAGGNVEADQLARRTKQSVIIVAIDQLSIDLPVHERSDDGIQLQLQQVGAKVGLPNDDTADDSQWCCDEHRAFGHWPFKQLYERSSVFVEEFAVRARYMGQVERMLEPGRLNVVIDSCLLPQQWCLPNIKTHISINQFAWKVSPFSLQTVMQCIEHLKNQQGHISTATSAMTKSKLATERMTATDPRQHAGDIAWGESDTGSDDESSPAQKHSGKIMHPTCFCLFELSNCTHYTLKLENWASKSGQMLSAISETVEPSGRVQWASAQRGKMKGNTGCAVFSIHDDTEGVHVEILLMWSIPWVGEDTVAVDIGKPGDFTFMAEMTVAKQRRELSKLISRHTKHLHQANGLHRATLGDIQVTSSFGSAPCKFNVFHRMQPGLIHESLHLPDDPRAVKHYRRHLTCHITNNTKHYLHVKKIVFGIMEGQCVKAIDPIIPPKHESVWSTAATRKLRGNVGCAIFSVGGVAELLIQWFLPNVGARLVDAILSNDGRFSSIPDSKLQEQLEQGPNVKTDKTDFTNFQGLHAIHEMLDKKTASFTLSAIHEVITDAALVTELPRIEDARTEGVKLWDYKRLALTCHVANVSASVVGHDSVREIAFKVEGIKIETQQSDLQTSANVELGALEVSDTFYSGEDMYLVTSHAYGGYGNFCNVCYQEESHPSRDFAHHGTVSTKIFIKTSPLCAKYTFNTVFFLLSLKNEAVQHSIPSAEPAQPGRSRIQSGDPTLASPAATQTLKSQAPEDNRITPVLELELQTGEVTVAICNSKLTPLVQLMVNKVDSTYKWCGENAHAVCHVDFGVYYHNMQLSAWEPLLEWTAVQMDVQASDQTCTTAIVSDEAFNLNITSELLASLVWIQADMAAYYDDDATNDPTEDCTLYVVNQCGVPVDFNIMNELSRKAEDSKRKQLLNLWKTIDSDQSGTLDRDEVRQVMTKMGKHLSEKQFDAAMSEIDTDNSGEIDFAEFLDWFQALHKNASPGTRVDHDGWTTTSTNGEPVGVPRDRVHMEAPLTFDPAALCNRGELSTNYVLFRLRSSRNSEDEQFPRNEWRPLKPQSLSSTGTWIHQLRPTMTSVDESQQNHSKTNKGVPKRAFVCVTVAHRNSATYITAQSPILVSNLLPVDLLMEITDDASFNRHDVPIPSQSSVPVPIHLVGLRVRFKQCLVGRRPQASADVATESQWTQFVRPGDSAFDHLELAKAANCYAYPVFMDARRGPDTCTMVLYCPLKFKNTLPCAIKITLTEQHMGKSHKSGTGKASPKMMCSSPTTNTKASSNVRSECSEQFVLQSGETFVPSCVDARVGMTIVVDLQGTATNQLCKLKQKAPAVVWPVHLADPKLKFLDESKRKLKLQLAYDSNPGRPTTVTIYATHWIVNETGLQLQYFDMSRGRGHVPANHEGRQWLTPEPFLWCFPKGTSTSNNKLSIGLNGKPDSQQVALSHPELCTTLEIRSTEAESHTRSRNEKTSGTKHRILCYVQNGRSHFMSTKVVYLRHELVMKNLTLHGIAIKCAEGDLPSLCVPPGQARPFSWSDNDGLYKSLKVHYDYTDQYSTSPPPEEQWSAEFEIGSQSSRGFTPHIGDLFLKVHHGTRKSTYTSLRIATTHDSTTRQTVVIITKQEDPYKIENHLKVKIGYRQLGTGHLNATRSNWQELKPGGSAPFNWDLPLSRALAGKQQLIEILVGQTTVTFDINAVGHSHEDTSRSVCFGEVLVEGHIRVLKLYQRIEHLPSRATFDPVDQLDNQVIELRLHSLGISLVDNASASPKELVYVLVDGLHVHSGSSSTQSATEVQIADIQVADQSISNNINCVKFGRHHSQIVNGVKVGSDTINGTRDHFHLAIISDLRNSSNICDVYSFVGLGVYPSVLTIDDEFVLNLWKYQQQISDKLAETFPETYGPDAETAATAAESQGDLIPQESYVENAPGLRKVYFRRLEIHPVMMEVSVKIDGSLFDGEGLGLPGFVQSLGVAFGNVVGARMSLDELREDDVFQNSDEFGNHVMSYYWGQLLVAGFRVLGASAFLGNPVALLGNVVDGLGDFFYLPLRGLVKSPTEMVKGFGKGTEALVTHTLSGTLSSVGTMTGAIGQSLDKLSDSESHARRLKSLRQKHGPGVVAGITVGTESLALGLMDGMSGIVLQPLHGLKTHGLPGLLQGMERGIVGAVAQPAAGALSFISEASTGATQTKILGYKVGDQITRARIPRPFFHGRLLTPYSQEWAAECATTKKTKPATATLKIVLHGILFPEVASGASVWPGPLRAAIAIGHSAAAHRVDTLAEGVADVFADTHTGLAMWSKNGSGQHQFDDISVELEDNALPSDYEVLSVTILSSNHIPGKEATGKPKVGRPLAQFDILLSGLGLDQPWKDEARRERAANMAGSTQVLETAYEGAKLPIRAAFDRMDKHGDGQISRAELIRALKDDEIVRETLGLPAQVGESERSLFEERFQALDSDDTRHFSWADFHQFAQEHCRSVCGGSPAADNSRSSGSRLDEHRKLHVRKGASWERDGLYAALPTSRGSQRKKEQIQGPSPTAAMVPEAEPPTKAGETQANAADEGRDVWPRPKIGEKCWIDVELQLVDDNGQLSRNASVRLRSESRRYSTDVKRIEDAKAKAQRRHHFSLLSSTVE